jgi:hypothetical protein
MFFFFFVLEKYDIWLLFQPLCARLALVGMNWNQQAINVVISSYKCQIIVSSFWLLPILIKRNLGYLLLKHGDIN